MKKKHAKIVSIPRINPMEVDLNYEFVDLAKNPIEGPRIKTVKGVEVSQNLTLRDALVDALTYPDKNTEHGDANEKIKRWKLAQRIYDSDKISLTSDEIVMLKKLTNSRYAAPLVVAQVVKLLDPLSEERIS